MLLQDVKTDLFDRAGAMPFEEHERSMQIARGPSEYLRPVNAGLLFLNDAPEQFFPYSWIEINIYHDDIGDSFTEKVFKGPIHQQLRKALAYIKSSVVEEHIQKVEGQAEAIRFYNYPYQAIEEALANAVYHKNYEEREPIEVNIRLDQIEILSHGGPMPPISQDDFKKERIVSRKYMNRRIGDFLKELSLTEGKSTGIPKIRTAMKNNGSREPIFEMDDARSYFLVTLPIQTFTVPLVPSDKLYPNKGLTPSDNRRIPSDTSEQERILLEHLLMHGSITSKKVEELLDIKESRTRELLKQMTEKGYILKQGQARGTYYIWGELEND
jgi:ATP-dependent DNA helicase RecG